MPEYYETPTLSMLNIKLEKLRKANDNQYYCRATNKQGKEVEKYSGYYFIKRLTKILNPK